MATVFDVAAYILHREGSLPAIKLQKLVYYAQAWSLVWDGKPMFRHAIQAWANGPVAPALYQKHRGSFKISRPGVGGDIRQLQPAERKTIDSVLKFYGNKDSQWLSDLTHAERPWKEARGSLAPGDRGTNVITQEAMAEYYGSL